MAFVRAKKTARGTTVYSLVANQRVNGKVRQSILAYLSDHPCPWLALAEGVKDLERARADLDEWNRRTDHGRQRYWFNRVGRRRRTNPDDGPEMERRIARFQERVNLLTRLRDAGLFPPPDDDARQKWEEHERQTADALREIFSRINAVR